MWFHTLLKIALVGLTLVGSNANAATPSSYDPPPSVAPAGMKWRLVQEWVCISPTLSPEQAVQEAVKRTARNGIGIGMEPIGFTFVPQGGKNCLVSAWKKLVKE
jgi:hypothetical protein